MQKNTNWVKTRISLIMAMVLCFQPVVPANGTELVLSENDSAVTSDIIKAGVANVLSNSDSILHDYESDNEPLIEDKTNEIITVDDLEQIVIKDDKLRDTDSDLLELGESNNEDILADENTDSNLHTVDGSYDAEDNIAKGKVNDVSWWIDNTGKLFVRGTGSILSDDYVPENMNYHRTSMPWRDYDDQIVAVDIELDGASNLKELFMDLRNVTSIDISGIRFSDVQNIDFMFKRCHSLKELDLSTMDLNLVEGNSAGIYYLFELCDDLEYILSPMNLKGDIQLPATNVGRWINTETGLNVTTIPNGTQAGTLFVRSNDSLIRVSDVDITQKQTVKIGESITLSASIIPSNATNKGILWKSDNEEIAGVDEKGVVVGKGHGKTNIIAITRDGGYTATCEISVAGDTTWQEDYTYRLEGSNIVLSAYNNSQGVKTHIFSTAIINGETYHTVFDVDCTKFFNRGRNLTEIIIDDVDTSYLKNMNSMFENCSSLKRVEMPDFHTQWVTKMSGLFRGCQNLEYIDMSSISTSKVTEFTNMFRGCEKLTSIDLSHIDTSNATSISGMFEGCENMQNIDLGNFNTMKVKSMSHVFSGCSNLVSVNLINVNTENVTNMSGMFEGCTSLLEIDLSDFNISRGTNVTDMLANTKQLSKIYVPGLVEETVKLPGCFYGDDLNKTAFTILPSKHSGVTQIERNVNDFPIEDVTISVDNITIDIEEKVLPVGGKFKIGYKIFPTNASNKDVVWSTSDMTIVSVDEEGNVIGNKIGEATISVETVDKGIRRNCKIIVVGETTWQNDFYYQLKDTDIVLGSYKGQGEMLIIPSFAVLSGKIYKSKMETCKGSFYNCTTLKSIDLRNVDISESTSMYRMFEGCTALTDIDFEGIDTSKVTDMTFMFKDCNSLKSIDLRELNTSKVSGMSSMFEGCTELTDINLSKFDTKNVNSMQNMFNGCGNIEDINVSSFDTSNLIHASGMFSECSKLKKINLGKMTFSKNTSFSGMFSGCSKLTKIDLSNFDFSSAKYLNGMFAGCSSLEEIDLRNKNISNAEFLEGMFQGCSSLDEVDMADIEWTKVKKTDSMFEGCVKLKYVDFKSTSSLYYSSSAMFKNCASLVCVYFNTNFAQIDNMSEMFYGCSKLTALRFFTNLKNVKYMNSMFKDCKEITCISLDSSEKYSPADVTDLCSGCGKLTFLGLQNADFSGLSLTEGMIDNCNNLQRIHTPVNIWTDIILPYKFVLLDDDLKATTTEYDQLPKNRKEFEIIAKKNSYVALDNMAFNITNKEIEVGEDFILSLVFTPSNAGIRYVEWRVDNNDIANVDYTGKVVGVAPGKAVITAYSRVEAKSARCEVIVKERLGNKYKKGDVTGDGEVAMGDVVKIARAVAGSVTLTEDEKAAADVTGDGEIAMGDVVKLARFVAGSIGKL